MWGKNPAGTDCRRAIFQTCARLGQKRQMVARGGAAGAHSKANREQRAGLQLGSNFCTMKKISHLNISVYLLLGIVANSVVPACGRRIAVNLRPA